MTQLVDTPPPSPTTAPAAGDPLAPPLADTPTVTLNAFQILMRRWSKLHPYNAGQVMRVTGTPDRERWKRAAESVIAELGLGKPRFHHGDLSVQFLPPDDVPIDHAPAQSADSTAANLQAFFNEELNRPFAAGDLPIRFCILPATRDALSGNQDSHYFAAVYDHWIADSRAMRELMHRIFDRYQSPDAAPTLPLLTVNAPCFKQLFRKHVGRLTRLTAMRESLKNIWRHRHGFRLNLRNPLDFTSRFLYRELPEGLIERLHRFAKSRGASVNDLFIAVIAQATGQYTSADRLTRRRKPLHFVRQQIGIGTIVDIRDAANQKLDQVFNLYLSSYTVLLDNPEKRTADDLTRAVSAETAGIKKSLKTVKGYWALVMARFWYDLYESPRFRATLLHKTVPVVAGISNVNMSNSWADPTRTRTAGILPASSSGSHETPEPTDPAAPRVLDYLRISPAGPLIPLVFTLTTIKGRLSLCVTYRTTSFREPDLLNIVADFTARLEKIASEPATS